MTDFPVIWQVEASSCAPEGISYFSLHRTLLGAKKAFLAQVKDLKLIFNNPNFFEEEKDSYWVDDRNRRDRFQILVYVSLRQAIISQ
jgi:hypothetical protein